MCSRSPPPFCCTLDPRGVEQGDYLYQLRDGVEQRNGRRPSAAERSGKGSACLPAPAPMMEWPPEERPIGHGVAWVVVAGIVGIAIAWVIVCWAVSVVARVVVGSVIAVPR